MEESKSRSRGITRRTQLLSAAAAVALIVAMAGTAIIVARNGSSDDIKSVNDKKKENSVTTTTAPLTQEQKLLKGNVTLFSDASSDKETTTFKLVDSLTGDEIPGFSEFVKNSGIKKGSIRSAGGDYLELTDVSASPSCDEIEFHYFNFRTGEVKQTKGRVGSGRVYSPSGNKYAQFQSTCNMDLDWRVTMTIVDVKKNVSRTIKPEPFDDGVDGPGSFINPTDVLWINDNQFLLSTSISTANGSSWSIEDLRKTISLNDSIRNESKAPSSSDGAVNTQDVKIVNGKILALISENNNRFTINSYADSEITMRVMDLTSGKDVWSKTLKGQAEDFGSQLFLDDSGQVVYGSLRAGDGEVSFVYDHNADKLTKPAGNKLFRNS